MRTRLVIVLSVVAVMATVLPAVGEVPYGTETPPGSEVGDWADRLLIDEGTCADGDDSVNDLPASFDCEEYWQLTDFRYHLDDPPADDRWDPVTAANPQSFHGVKGPGVNTAWEVTTGRPDVVIAVMDSGIRWEETGSSTRDLVEKHHLNRGELPVPSSGPNLADARFDGYDVDGDVDQDGVADGSPDGVFNVVDYWTDPRVTTQPQGGDLNGNGLVDPEDLIRIFSDGVDDDGNGYVDDISGWDFFEDDNNPQDDTDHNHGTKEARWSVGEAGEADGPCPNCMHLPMRVGDSFVADVNQFAEAVVYAVDNGAQVVQEALGTLNHTSFGQAAIDHAYRNGVVVMASAADEAAGHHNWPAAYEHTLVVNSIVPPTEPGDDAPLRPYDHLYFNGCTNFGGYIHVSIPSDSCSSEATGRSAGMSGLLYSAAWNAIERGDMTPYVTDDGRAADFPLSVEEVKQLWRLAADDIDFATPPPLHPFSDDAPDDVLLPTGTANNYATSLPGTTRYQTVQGWDYFTGYGRSNAARLVHYIGAEDHPTLGDREYEPTTGVHAPYGFGSSELQAQDRIPPEADIVSPRFWRQYEVRPDGSLVLPDDPDSPGEVVVHGRVAANRVTADGGTFDWVLEYAPHVQGLTFPRSQDPAVAPAADSEEASTGPWTPIAGGEGLTAALEGELGRIDATELVDALDPLTNPFDPVLDPTSEFQPERFAVRLRLRVLAHPANPTDQVNNEAVHQKQVDVLPAGAHTMRDDIGVPLDDRTGIGMADALDPDALGRYSGGAGSPSFHDLDGDGTDELLLPTADGVVHAYTDVAAGAELPGWPVTTDVLDSVTRHTVGDGTTPVVNGFTTGAVTTAVHGSLLLGSVAVADLDDDGDAEVVAADMEGRVHAWSHDGTPHVGFPVEIDPALSTESSCEGQGLLSGGDGTCDDYDGVDAPAEALHGDAAPLRDKHNERDRAVNAAPAIGDLDPTTPGLEVVVGSNDSHVHAWHQDGTPVEGWPVVLRDPTKVAAMDPTTRFWTYADDANEERGSKIVVSPSLGDLDGDGDLEVVLGVNEEYEEPVNMSAEDPSLVALSAISSVGNTRLYALHHTGAATPGDAGSDATPHTQDQAYVDGWPARMALLATALLPYVGEGTNGQTPLYDADGDGTLEAANASVIGPGHVFDHDGTSYLGEFPDGNDRTLASGLNEFGTASRATDGPAIVGLGGLSVGSLDGGDHLTLTGPGVGLRRLLDVLFDGDQAGAEDHLLLWNASEEGGDFEPNAPVIVNDLMFFAPAVIADVTGDGQAEAVQATAVSDVVAVGLGDEANTTDTALRWHTGGWSINAPAVGDAPATADGDALSIATVTREGWLRLLPTSTAVDDCAALVEWPEYGHDAFNSGNHETDAERPGPVAGLTADTSGPGDARPTLRLTAPGDDRDCGTVAGYEVRRTAGRTTTDWSSAAPVAIEPPNDVAASGDEQVLEVAEDLPVGTHTLLVRARDDAGNGSPVAAAVVEVHGPDVVTPTESPTDTPPAAIGPTADAGPDRRVLEGRGLTLDGTGSSSDGPLAHAWDLGDGRRTTGHRVSHVWQRPGTYTVRLTVTDADGARDVDTARVVVVDEEVLAGDDRIATAVAVSRHAQGSAGAGFGETVVLARRDAYPDALAGAPLARSLDAPVLLTDRLVLSEATSRELERLGTSRVIVLGGPQAVDDAVVRALLDRGIAVERVAGADRFATALEVARRIPSDRVYVVEGQDLDPSRGWPDAVSIAPIAAEQGRPILLVTTDRIPAATSTGLDELDVDDVTIVGGPVAVSERVAVDLAADGRRVRRVAGGDRYATSVAVSRLASSARPETVWLATGRDWPDALAAGPAVPLTSGVLLLLDGRTSGPDVVLDRVASLAEHAEQIVVLGGPVAISSATRDAVADRVRR